jgi:hypothetical protein
VVNADPAAANAAHAAEMDETDPGASVLILEITKKINLTSNSPKAYQIIGNSKLKNAF